MPPHTGTPFEPSVCCRPDRGGSPWWVIGDRCGTINDQPPDPLEPAAVPAIDEAVIRGRMGRRHVKQYASSGLRASSGDATMPVMTSERSSRIDDRREGLDWLGRTPTARAGPIVRLLLRLFRWGTRAIGGIGVTVEGREHLPDGGGYILACAAHRSWYDGPLLLSEFVEPRLWYIASAVAIFPVPGLEWFMRRFGGMVPVYRGGTDLDVHVTAASAILEAGAVFGIYPEGARAGEGDRIAPFRRGVGLIGLRTGARIVPVALGGTKELYRGRRIGLRILPPTTALMLAGIETSPARNTADELEAARHATEALALVLAPHVTELARRAEDPPDHPRPWRWMSHLFG